MSRDPRAALKVANETRTRRAQFRREAQRPDVAAAIVSPPPWMEKAEIEWLLRTAPGIGPALANEILRRQQISPTRRVRSLTRRQRRNLAEALR